MKKTLSEQEIMEEVKKSAANVEIPKGISPERMKQVIEESENSGKSKKRKLWTVGGKTVAAAIAVIVCTTGLFSIHSNRGGRLETADSNPEIESSFSAQEGEEDGMEVLDIGTVEEPKKNAGDLYIVAKDYAAVYDVLKKELNRDQSEEFSDDISQTTGETSYLYDGKYSGSPVINLESNKESANHGEEEKYSATNLQMQDVDESDMIKNDGSYIYTVQNNRVKIIEVQNGRMTGIGEIRISVSSATDRVRELYLDGDYLSLIMEKEDTKLQQDMPGGKRDNNVAEVEDLYYINTNKVTELQTYDISDRKNPVYQGTVTQEGAYKTSRKIGDMIYLFTEKFMEMPNLTKGQAIAEGNTGEWIPSVNGKVVPADCIYLPQYGNQALVISSTNVKKPDQIVDNTVILNNYVDIYISKGALYLYQQDNSSGGVTTQVAKFELKRGKINAVEATSVPGAVYDTFAIHEYQGQLRILTTDWKNGVDCNNLYLFDENLKMTGKLEKIAEGEQIYAARFFEDTAYFVTYRNTDPLFAVDLSDEKNPKILSELKISGFSEYLHFWGEDKLVGIGYETDPQTGAQKGIKLTMFDISDPAKLKIAGTCVIENADYSPALYDYKCVLLDAAENMIGFAAGSYEKNNGSYLLFSWNKGQFQELLTESLGEGADLGSYRGIYIGEVFYLVNPENIISFDRKEDYRFIEKYDLS